jgi:hypothetical protein
VHVISHQSPDGPGDLRVYVILLPCLCTESCLEITCSCGSYWLVVTHAALHEMSQKRHITSTELTIRDLFSPTILSYSSFRCDEFVTVYKAERGPGSSVGIATGYGLEGPGIELAASVV